MLLLVLLRHDASAVGVARGGGGKADSPPPPADSAVVVDAVVATAVEEESSLPFEDEGIAKSDVITVATPAPVSSKRLRLATSSADAAVKPSSLLALPPTSSQGAPLPVLLAEAPLEECLHVNGSACYNDPTVWGPPTWFFLHSMTLALPSSVPEEQQKAVRELMYNMQKVLPCATCGDNLKEHMQNHPIEPHLSSRDSLVQWMIDIHNMVNANCGKPEIAAQDALRKYNAAFHKDEAGRHPFGFRAVLDRNSGLRSTRPSSSTSAAWVLAFLVSALPFLAMRL